MLRRMQHDGDRLREELDGAGELVTALEMMEDIAVHEACRAWLAWSAGDGATARTHAEEALSLWAQRAPRFPLKWLARLPLLALDLANGHVDDALIQARELRADGQARLGNGVSEALDDLLAQSPGADPATLESGFADVIERARAFGYL